MTLEFRHLPEELRPLAIAVAKYFGHHEGTSCIEAEVEVAPEINYRPTLLGKSSDRSLLAVEVRDSLPTSVLHQFVADCITRGWAIRLFIAVPAGMPEGEWKTLFNLSRTQGIGLIEVTNGQVTAQRAALPLGLMGLRTIDPGSYPRAYRADLRSAQDTFLNGNPAKGCAELYDTIEFYSRRVARRIGQLGLWRSGVTPKKRSDSWYESTAWASVLAEVADHADFKALQGSAVRISRPLWSSVVALTPDRNETGHKPKTRKKLEARNTQLRTRFENAADVLAKLYKAAGRSVRA